MKEGLAGDWIGQAPIWWWSLQTMQNIHKEIKYAHVCLPTHVWNQDEIVPHKWSPPVSVGWFYRTTAKDGLCSHLSPGILFLPEQTNSLWWLVSFPIMRRWVLLLAHTYKLTGGNCSFCGGFMCVVVVVVVVNVRKSICVPWREINGHGDQHLFVSFCWCYKT